MVGKTIGNGECQCIFSFEKNYLKLGLDRLIEEENEKIKKAKIEWAKHIKKSGIGSRIFNL